MLDPVIVATSIAISFTVGAFAIARAGPHTDQATAILALVAVGLGMLSLIGGLSQLNAQGPAVSQADARPEFGMSWRPPRAVSDRTVDRPIAGSDLERDPPRVFRSLESTRRREGVDGPE